MDKNLWYDKQVKALCKNFKKEELAKELVLFYTAYEMAKNMRPILSFAKHASKTLKTLQSDNEVK